MKVDRGETWHCKNCIMRATNSKTGRKWWRSRGYYSTETGVSMSQAVSCEVIYLVLGHEKIQKIQIKLSLISSLVTSVNFANQLFHTKINKSETTQSLGLSWVHLHANPTANRSKREELASHKTKETYSVVFLTNLHFLILIFFFARSFSHSSPPPPLPTITNH